MTINFDALYCLPAAIRNMQNMEYNSNEKIRYEFLF